MTVEILEFSPGAYTWCDGHTPEQCRPPCPMFGADSDLPVHPETVITLRVALGLSAPDDKDRPVARHIEHIVDMTDRAKNLLAEAAAGAEQPTSAKELVGEVALTGQLRAGMLSMAAELAEVGEPGAGHYVVSALAVVPGLERQMSIYRELHNAAMDDLVADVDSDYPRLAQSGGWRPLNWD